MLFPVLTVVSCYRTLEYTRNKTNCKRKQYSAHKKSEVNTDRGNMKLSSEYGCTLHGHWTLLYKWFSWSMAKLAVLLSLTINWPRRHWSPPDHLTTLIILVVMVQAVACLYLYLSPWQALDQLLTTLNLDVMVQPVSCLYLILIQTTLIVWP